MNQSNLAVNQILSFETLKTSAYASAKINLGDELDMDDLGALFAVNDYFKQRLGHSVFSGVEIAAISDALEKHGMIYVEAQ